MRKTLMTMLASTLLAAAADVAVELEAAIRRETVQGDVKGAVEAYRKIATSAGKNREVAARALLRLGLAYRKLGDAQARQTLERLVKEYGDQPRMVEEARSELARLGGGGTPKSSLTVRQLWRAGDEMADSVSRDGTLASVMDWRTANAGVRNLRTGETKMLTSFGNWNRQTGVVCCTKISPDGKWVTFRTTVGWQKELRMIRTDGTQMTTLFRAARDGNVVPLDWMPDGRGVLSLIASGRLQASGRRRETLAVIPVSGGENRTVKEYPESRRGVPVTAVSPDGKWIAMSSAEGSTQIISADNGSENPFGSGAGVIGWSPDSSMLLYVGYRSGAPGVYRVAMENGRPKGPAEMVRALTMEPHPIGVDGKGRAYYREGIYPTNAYTMGIEAAAGRATSSPVRVTQRYEDWNFAPVWSPDGSKLAWFAGKSDSRRLFVRDVAKGTETSAALQIAAHMRISPAWLSGAQSILAGTRGGNVPTVLYRVDPATGTATQFYSTKTFAQAWDIAWSADGSKVYDIRGAAMSEIDPASGQRREIFRDPAAQYIRDVAPCPDGKSFAYVAHQDSPDGSPDFYGPVHIKIYDTTEGKSRELVAVRPSWNRRMMAWTPDGRHLIYATEWYAGKNQPTRLWVVPAEGGTPKQLGGDFKGRVFSLTVSPDGKQLGFEEEHELNELWAMEGAFGR